MVQVDAWLFAAINVWFIVDKVAPDVICATHNSDRFVVTLGEQAKNSKFNSDDYYYCYFVTREALDYIVHQDNLFLPGCYMTVIFIWVSHNFLCQECVQFLTMLFSVVLYHWR
jgi:hypothetical protein